MYDYVNNIVISVEETASALTSLKRGRFRAMQRVTVGMTMIEKVKS